MVPAVLAKLVGLAIAGQVATGAQPPEKFYESRPVTLVVAAPPGSAADMVGRRFATFFQKHLPGQPEVIVANKPAAGGMMAASELMLSDAKDGTVIAFLRGSNIFNPLVDDKHEQFDPRRVKWLGSVDIGEYPYAVMAWAHSPVQSADDIFNKRMVIGATSYTHENRVLPALMNRYLGATFDIVPGYSSSTDLFLAMERGEADGWFEGFAALENTDRAPGSYLREGKIRPLLIIGFERQAKWPDVPIITDYMKTDEQKRMVKFFLTPLLAGRPLAVPGEVPDNRVDVLRRAFDATVNDMGFIATMQGVMTPSTLKSLTGAEVDAMIDDVYATPRATLAAARSFLARND